MSEDQNKQFEKAYQELQNLDKRGKDIQENLKQLDRQMNEFEITKNALSQLNDIELGKEMFVPISPGIFVKATIADNKEVMVNVGAGVGVEKPVDKARELIVAQSEELGSIRETLVQQLQDVYDRAQKLEENLRQYYDV